LNPKKRRWKVKFTRHVRSPREEDGVDQAGKWATLVCAGHDKISESLGATALDLGHVVAGVVTIFKAVVVAVGVGGEGQAVEIGGFGHAAAGGDGGDEGDMRPQANEALGELEAGIDMALDRICYEEEVGPDHDVVLAVTAL
jgi:hypothetical protein